MSNFPVYSACDLISTENSESEIVVHELQDLLTEKSFIPENLIVTLFTRFCT